MDNWWRNAEEGRQAGATPLGRRVPEPKVENPLEGKISKKVLEDVILKHRDALEEHHFISTGSKSLADRVSQISEKLEDPIEFKRFNKLFGENLLSKTEAVNSELVIDSRAVLHVDLSFDYQGLKFEEFVSMLPTDDAVIPEKVFPSTIFLDQQSSDKEARLVYWDINAQQFMTSKCSSSDLQEMIIEVSAQQKQAEEDFRELTKETLDSFFQHLTTIEEVKDVPKASEMTGGKFYSRLVFDENPPSLHLYALDLKNGEVLTTSQAFKPEDVPTEELLDWVAEVRFNDMSVHFDQLAAEGLFLGDKEIEEQDFSLKDQQLVKIYTDSNKQTLRIAYVDPEDGIQTRSIHALNVLFTKESMDRWVDRANKQAVESFSKALGKHPVVEAFTDEGLETPPFYQVTLEPSGVDVVVRGFHYSVREGVVEEQIVEEKIPISKLETEKRFKKLQADELIHTVGTGRVIYGDSSKVENHFAASTIPLIYSNEEMTQYTLWYKDLIDGSVIEMKTNPKDLQKQLLSIENLLSFEELKGKKPPSISEELESFLQSQKKADPVRLANFKATLEKCQTFVETKGFSTEEGDLMRLSKRSGEKLGATLWRGKEGDFMVLPSQVGTKRFAAGAFKAASLAVELKKDKPPSMVVWSTMLESTNPSVKTMMRSEINIMKEMSKSEDKGSQYLLKLKLATPYYKAKAQHREKIGKVKKIGIVTEYCDIGELSYQTVKNLPVKDRLEIFKQILLATSALHKKKYVHSDIKPENVFLKTNEAGKPEARLADFGLTKVNGNRQLSGSPLYMSLPILKKKFGVKGFDPAVKQRFDSDIYALGISAYEALLGGKFPDDNPDQSLEPFLNYLEQRTATGESALDISQSELEKSKFLQLISKMAHTDNKVIPKSIDEVLVSLDEILADENELAAIDAFIQRINP